MCSRSRRSGSRLALLLSGLALAACGPGGTTTDDEVGDDTSTTDSETGDGDGDGDTGDGDGDTGVLEECYEISEDSCPDTWPMLSCSGTDPVCDTLTYNSETDLDTTQAATLECILGGLRDGTPGVYRVEDTWSESPRSLYIQMLANGNALIAKQESNFGCVYEEAVEGVPQADDFWAGCLDGVLDLDTIESCVFNVGTGCAFYVGDPCGG